MRNAFYPVVVDLDPDTDQFTVALPDLGVSLQVGREEDPYLAAIEAAVSKVESLRLTDEDVPLPTELARHARRRGHGKPHMVFTVPVPRRRGYVRVSLALAPELLRRIDDQATARGLTRSSFVSQLAADALRVAA